MFQEKIEQGEALFAQGEIEEAEKCFLSILEKDPTDVHVLNNLGVIRHVSGKTKEAESLFLKAISAKSNYTDALLNLADLYQANDRLQEAAIQLKKCVLLDPTNMDLGNRLAEVYLELDENQKARQTIKTIRGSKIENNALSGTVHAENFEKEADSAARFRGRPEKVTMNKVELIEVLKRICFFPHPDANRGQLLLGKEIFEDDDRETNVVISPLAKIDLTGDITIGPWTMIGDNTEILTHDHFHEGRGKPLLKLQEENGIRWLNKIIGSDVWLHGCTVLYQVTHIPDGVVVGSGAVLTKNPCPYEIWAGNPAKKIGER